MNSIELEERLKVEIQEATDERIKRAIEIQELRLSNIREIQKKHPKFVEGQEQQVDAMLYELNKERDKRKI